MSKTKKQPATDKLSFAVLAPLASYCERNPGTYTKIAEHLSRRTGKRMYAANVNNWLKAHWQDRAEPRFGLGLMLLDLWKSIEAGNWPKS